VSDAADPLRRLSRTERIVVNLISGGCARDEIARALGVPSGEAEGIVSGILRKLRLRSTSEIPPLVERRLLAGEAE
jgi:DNA-binding NarL/FixJ family response regulator